jgi:thiamine-phosphate pyrophosphorylase
MIPFRFYPISNVERTGEAALLESLERAARSGLRAFQLREKGMSARDLLSLALRARAILRPLGALLFVNDRVDVALAAGADGVHLPATSLPPDRARALWPRPRLLGVSAHDGAEMARAREGGADFVTLAPVFSTPGKPAPLGLERFGGLAREAGLPVLALGGVNLERIPDCLRAGAHGVSAIGLFRDSPDIEADLGRIEALLGSL